MLREHKQHMYMVGNNQAIKIFNLLQNTKAIRKEGPRQPGNSINEFKDTKIRNRWNTRT